MLGLLLLSLTLQAPAPPPAEPPLLELNALLARRDYERYQRAEKYHDRLKILRSNLESRQDALPEAIDQRRIPQIIQALLEIRSLCHWALEESSRETRPKERSHAEVKRLEILLRKLGEALESEQLQVPLEDRHTFESTRTLVEQLRDQLLRQLFGKALGTGSSPAVLHWAPPAPVATRGGGSQGLWDRDRFTEAEFTQIQMAQEIVKRVEAFLKIAESRLAEIDRRRQGKEWEEKEPNPLEFFTYEDLFFSYGRAIEGVMTNIDAQSESGFAAEKDIRKSLKKLAEKVADFGPRLKQYEELIREQRDQALYEQWEQAQQATEIARQGAAYGLGAPEP